MSNKNKMSRAEFLKLTTAFGAGIAVGGTGVAIALSSKEKNNKQKNNAELYDPDRLDDLPDRAFGMDISHNNTLDIKKFYKEVQLKKLNDKINETIPVNIAYLRIGQGLNINDKAFSENWKTIKAYNQSNKLNEIKMATGIYFLYDYTQDAKQQAEKFISLVEDITGGDLGQLIPMLDVEDLSNLGKKLPEDSILQKDVKIWLDSIKNHFGITPGIYSGRSFAINRLDGKNMNGKFSKYKKWIASYNDEDYNNSKNKTEQKLGYLPALIQWSQYLPLPGTGNHKGDTDGNDTENLPELFIKNNLIGDKYNPQGKNEGQNEKKKKNKQEDIDANTAGINSGKIGGIIGGLAMAISSILYYSRDKNKTDRRAFLKKAIKVIAATAGGALVGALSGKGIENIGGLDMEFNEAGTTCTITIDNKEIMLFRNVLDPENKKLGMTVQIGGEIYRKIPIENKEEIEGCIAQNFEGFEFSNRDRRKILKNMDYGNRT